MKKTEQLCNGRPWRSGARRWHKQQTNRAMRRAARRDLDGAPRQRAFIACTC